jgi:short subunit dehydrogenase-like uncharacterized protein
MGHRLRLRRDAHHRPGEKGEAIAKAVAADKSLGAEGGPKPGEGPSREEREAGFYDVLFLGEDAAGHRLRVASPATATPATAPPRR